MDSTIIRHIVLGIYKHNKNSDIQVSYKSKLVWIKTKGRWKEYTFMGLVREYCPNNITLLKLAGAMK